MKDLMKIYAQVIWETIWKGSLVYWLTIGIGFVLVLVYAKWLDIKKKLERK